jgi:hypothetical protein
LLEGKVTFHIVVIENYFPLRNLWEFLLNSCLQVFIFGLPSLWFYTFNINKNPGLFWVFWKHYKYFIYLWKKVVCLCHYYRSGVQFTNLNHYGTLKVKQVHCILLISPWWSYFTMISLCKYHVSLLVNMIHYYNLF